MGIAYRKKVDDDTEFALWKIEENAEELYKQLQLNDAEKAFIQKLSNSKRYLHWLGTRVLLRKLLNTEEYIDCKVDEHGKPYLTSLPYHISLSHSFKYAAVMISRNKPVGIDIEKIEQKVERIAHKFMRPEEMAFINPNDQINQLYACWCAKEAVYKCYGRKEISFLNHIFLTDFVCCDEGTLHAEIKTETIKLDFDVEYLQFDNYMIGYAKEV
ncbi:MAG: 4'-phosphopantetheinyl transferase superfamily protein [Sphingobacteriaceae bacterium]|nr:MAG: 4'-phosphopantetheinyl transferase superfamily protein [Sphingobacteriaceae bacterium]